MFRHPCFLSSPLFRKVPCLPFVVLECSPRLTLGVLGFVLASPLSFLIVCPCRLGRFRSCLALVLPGIVSCVRLALVILVCVSLSRLRHPCFFVPLSRLCRAWCFVHSWSLLILRSCLLSSSFASVLSLAFVFLGFCVVSPLSSLVSGLVSPLSPQCLVSSLAFVVCLFGFRGGFVLSFFCVVLHFCSSRLLSFFCFLGVRRPVFCVRVSTLSFFVCGSRSCGRALVFLFSLLCLVLLSRLVWCPRLAFVVLGFVLCSRLLSSWCLPEASEAVGRVHHMHNAKCFTSTSPER